MATKDKAAGPATKGLEVVAKCAAFWRGGQPFSRTARVVPLADLSAEQAKQIRAEGDLPAGMLVVTEVDIEPAKA